MDNKTIEEVFTGVKLDVRHLCIFGFLVDFHVLKDKRNKLEATRRKCTFIGYCENYKAFRIYIVCQRKVEISKDVTYDEDVSLWKARDLPPPPSPKKNDDINILDGPSVPESKMDIVDDPMEPMDPLDPPPCDPPARKRPLFFVTHYRMMRDKFPFEDHLENEIIHADTRDVLQP